MRFYGPLISFWHSRLVRLAMVISITAVFLMIPEAIAQHEKLGVSDQVTITVTRGTQNSSAVTPEFPVSTLILAVALSSILIFTLSANRTRKTTS